MTNYNIQSDNLNKNRIFILRKSELEKRLDPIYYSHLFNEFEKILLKKPFKKFHQLIKTITNGFDFRDYKEEGTPYLKVANVKKGELDFSKIQYLDFNSTELSKKIQLRKGNLLLTRKGTFGNAFALKSDYDFIISSEVFYIELQQDLINAKFLEIFFNSRIGQAQFDKNKIGAIMGSLSQEAIRDLIIPYPPLEIQNQIIDIYNKYNIVKQQNEAQAEKLLAGIDDYLLNELGIKPPELPENSLKNRMFMTNFKTVSGERFDPQFNKIYFNEVFSAFSKSKFQISRIKEVLENLKTGTTPNQKLEPYTERNGITFLRNSNLKKYKIDLTDTKFVKNELSHLLTYSTKGEVIVCIAGTVGISAINEIEVPIAINQNVSALKFNENKINSYFASYWFNTKIFIELLQRACSIATILYLNNENLKFLPIPIPPLEKQQEIAKHITNIRIQAQHLKEQANIALKKANQEIEKLLLGN